MISRQADLLYVNKGQYKKNNPEKLAIRRRKKTPNTTQAQITRNPERKDTYKDYFHDDGMKQ